MPTLNKSKSSVNLLPHEEEEKTLTSRLIHWLLTTFRFLVISVELIVIVGFLSRFFLDSQNSDLTDEINQKKALIESYLPFENQFKAIQKRVDLAKSYYEGQINFSDIYDTVSKHITSSVTLVSVQKKGASVDISVSALDEQAIARLTQELSKEILFSDIHVSLIESVPLSDQVKATIVGTVGEAQTETTTNP